VYTNEYPFNLFRGLSCLGCKGREESPKIIKKPLKVNRLPEEVGEKIINVVFD